MISRRFWLLPILTMMASRIYVGYNASALQTEGFYVNNNALISSGLGPTLPAGWRLVTMADFNADGHPDYLLFNPTTQQSQIWYLSGVTKV
jgi:hypothetical protein